MRSIFSQGSVLLLAAAQLTKAHTWIEEMNIIAPNGTFVGAPGYARGNILRGAPGFHDQSWLIPPNGDRAVNNILPSDLICMPSQTTKSQTSDSPRLQAPAGAMVALRYLENGHTTIPEGQQGKPFNRGTNYVYGTTQSSPDDSLLSIHRQWTPNGSGGDGRGALISTRNFDDGQCYENNGHPLSNQRAAQFPVPGSDHGAKLMCQQDIALPKTLKAGDVYTLYWVWDWPTMPGTAGFPNGKQEIYTTCMDIDIIDSPSSGAVSKATVQFATGQPVGNAAVPAQLLDITNPTAVASAQTIAFTVSGSAPAVDKPTAAATSSAAVIDKSSGQPSSPSASPTTVNTSVSPDHTAAKSASGVMPSIYTVIPIGGTKPSNTASAVTSSQPTAAPQPTSQQQSGGSKAHDSGDNPGSGFYSGTSGDHGSGTPSPSSQVTTKGSAMPVMPSGFTVVPISGVASGSLSASPANTPTGQPGSNVAASAQPDNNRPMSTYTHWDTATQFVTMTVVQTQYTKRTSESTTTPTSASETPSETVSATSTVTSSSQTSQQTISTSTAASWTLGWATSLLSDTTAPLPTYTAPSSATSSTDTDGIVIDEHIVTDSPPAPTPTVDSSPIAKRAAPTCSQQHRAFRLRARLPFVTNFLDETTDC